MALELWPKNVHKIPQTMAMVKSRKVTEQLLAKIISLLQILSPSDELFLHFHTIGLQS